jgi:hypothetical protein
MLELAQVSEMLVRSSFCGVKRAEDALWIVATGHSLGIDPVTSLRGIHVISGKPVLSADLMAAVAMRHPACEYLRVAEMTPERCVVHVKRKGWPEHTAVAFGMEDAKAAQLLKNPTWQKYPADMCKARAIARAARLAFPDALLGVYVDGELEADEPTTVTYEPLPADTHRLQVETNSKPQLLAAEPAPAPRRQSKTDQGEEHDALRNQMRAWIKEAALTPDGGELVRSGFVARFASDGAREPGEMALADLRTGVEDLKVRITRHGLRDALRDLTEHAGTI